MIWQVLAVLLVAVCAGAGLAARPVRGGASGAPAVPAASTTPAPTAASTTPAAPTPDATGTTAASPLFGADAGQAAALQALLSARAAAVMSGDRQAWLATVDPRATDFRARQAEVFDNLRGVPFASFDLTTASLAPGPSPQRVRVLAAPSLVLRVLAGYRLEGFDRTDSEVEQQLTCVERDGRWYVAGDTDGSTQVQPWDLGPVNVVVDGQVLALGTASRETLQQYARQGAAGLRRVTSVWGGSWPQRAVLLVPRDQGEMARLLQRSDESGLDQVAAVTTGELPEGGGPAGSDRVLINPGAVARLTDRGRHVVLAHELTHVAVRSSTASPVPIWLSEGFADYVGYLGVDIGRAAVAAQLLELTRQGKGFTALPTDTDFDASRTTIAPAYSASWLACTLVVDRYGQDALVRLYRAAAEGDGSDPDTALSQALESVLGATQPAFTAAWMQYVDRLAAGGG